MSASTDDWNTNGTHEVLPLTAIVPLINAQAAEGLYQGLLASQDQLHQALDKVGTVHFARFVFLDSSRPGLKPATTFTGAGPFSLAVITEFDAPYNGYIKAFAEILTVAFNDILAASSDADGLQLHLNADGTVVEADLERFVAYVRAHDLSRHQPNSKLELYIGKPYQS